MKDKSHKDHLWVPKEAQDALFYNQQSTAQDKVYVMVQPMPEPQLLGIPHFTGQNVLQFIE